MKLRKIKKEEKSELMIIGICFALCILVIGLGLKYNRLVRDYNEVVEEVNDCRQENFIEMPGTHIQMDLNKFFEVNNSGKH